MVGIVNNPDVWYDFVMPFDGLLNISNTFSPNQKYTLYETCGGAQLKCTTGNTDFTGLRSSVTYVLRMSNVLDNAGNNNFRVQAFAAPVNNECSNALALSGDLAAGITVPFDNSNSAATAGITCQILNADLWYSFTMLLMAMW